MIQRLAFLILLLCAVAFPQAVNYQNVSSTTNSACAPGALCPILAIPGARVTVCSATGFGVVSTAGNVVMWVSGPTFAGVVQGEAIQINGAQYVIQTPVSSTIMVLTTSAGTQSNVAYSNVTACGLNAATTYTGPSAGTSCPLTAQLTPILGGPCTATTDNQGNLNFWAMPGIYYFYVTNPASTGGQTTGPYPISIGSSAGCPLGVTCDARYATLALGCTAAGAGTLYVTQNWNALSTQTLACQLVFLSSGRLQPSSGQTVTISKPLAAGLTQIFDTSLGGTIAVTAPIIQFYPQWWGATGNYPTVNHDDYAAIQAAMTTCGATGAFNGTGGGVYFTGASSVILPAGNYAVGTNLQWGTCDLTADPNSSGVGAALIWIGSNGGTLLTRLSGLTAPGGCSYGKLKHIDLYSNPNASSMSAAATLLDCQTVVDVGFQLEDAGFHVSSGPAILLEGGHINLHWNHLRFDSCGTFCIQDVIPGGTNLSSFDIDQFTYDHHCAASPSSLQSYCGGNVGLGLVNFVFPALVSNIGIVHIANGRVENTTSLSGNAALISLTPSSSGYDGGGQYILENVTWDLASQQTGVSALYRNAPSGSSFCPDLILKNVMLDYMPGSQNIVGGTYLNCPSPSAPLSAWPSNGQIKYFDASPPASPFGAPTCLTGTGVDGTGGTACSATCAGCGLQAGSTPYYGVVAVQTSGTPAANQNAFVFTEPTGAFVGIPKCTQSITYFNIPAGLVFPYAVSPSTSTSLVWVSVGTALTTNTLYKWAYSCPSGQ